MPSQHLVFSGCNQRFQTACAHLPRYKLFSGMQAQSMGNGFLTPHRQCELSRLNASLYIQDLSVLCKDINSIISQPWVLPCPGLPACVPSCCPVHFLLVPLEVVFPEEGVATVWALEPPSRRVGMDMCLQHDFSLEPPATARLTAFVWPLLGVNMHVLAEGGTVSVDVSTERTALAAGRMELPVCLCQGRKG